MNNPTEDEKNEPPKKKRKIDQEKEEKEKQALFNKIKQNPEFSHIQKQIEEGDLDLLARLLDEPHILNEMVAMRSLFTHFAQFAEIQSQGGLQNNKQLRQEDTKTIQLKKAKSINDKWFKSNSPTQIIKQTRNEFKNEANSRKSIGYLVNDIIKNLYNLELSEYVCDEIEILSLNDETINIIEIDAEIFDSHINEILSNDINYVENNLLNNTTLNIESCIFTPYFDEIDLYFRNNSNIINCNKQHTYDNDNKTLNGNRIKCGDIIHIESTSQCTGFSHLWYIMDTDNITLRRIGIKAHGQYIQYPHIIIPGFVTSHLLDPIKLYSTFIHHHSYEDGGGVIEIELQISKRLIVLNENNKYLMNNMDDKEAKKIIAIYGWTQKDWGKRYRKNKHFIQDMEKDEYYTIYITTDAGSDGPLIGTCNHPKIDKINLSAICHEDATFGYIVKYTNESKNYKILSENQVNQLLLNLDSNINIDKVSNCLKRGIAFGVIEIDKNKGLDTILHNGQCLVCCSKVLISCSIRNALYQSDYGGHDCEDGGYGGAVKCDETDGCCGMYISGMCTGSMQFDSGKFHNHCNECTNMGTCIYDYRNTHCYGCNDHYFAVFGGYGCDNCNPRQRDVDL